MKFSYWEEWFGEGRALEAEAFIASEARGQLSPEDLGCRGSVALATLRGAFNQLLREAAEGREFPSGRMEAAAIAAAEAGKEVPDLCPAAGERWRGVALNILRYPSRGWQFRAFLALRGINQEEVLRDLDWFFREGSPSPIEAAASVFRHDYSAKKAEAERGS